MGDGQRQRPALAVAGGVVVVVVVVACPFMSADNKAGALATLCTLFLLTLYDGQPLE
jgi:hypothetical protein